jgi:transcription antitermination factor NusG
LDQTVLWIECLIGHLQNVQEALELKLLLEEIQEEIQEVNTLEEMINDLAQKTSEQKTSEQDFPPLVGG